jgi:hypothetical protein
MTRVTWLLCSIIFIQPIIHDIDRFCAEPIAPVFDVLGKAQQPGDRAHILAVTDRGPTVLDDRRLKHPLKALVILSSYTVKHVSRVPFDHPFTFLFRTIGAPDPIIQVQIDTIKIFIFHHHPFPKSERVKVNGFP